MDNIAYPPRRTLSIGEVLDLAFRIYRLTIIKCLVLAGIAVILQQLPNLYNLIRGQGMGGGLSGFMQAAMGAKHDPVYWVLYIGSLLLTVTFYAAVLLRQQRLATQGACGAEVTAALRRLPAVAGVSLISGLCIGACLLPAVLFSGPARAGAFVVLLIGPATYVTVMGSCAFTALLVGGFGPVASYLRSWRLTAGSFWRLSVIYSVAILVLFAFLMVIGIIGAMLAGVLGRGDVALIGATSAVVVVVVSAVTIPFYSALALAVYGDLTVRKEGADLEQRLVASA